MIALLFVLALQQSGPPDGMALIPAGEFWMGRVHYFLIDEVGWLERDRRDDLPAHKVYVNALYMDKYEVTNEEFARFLDKSDAKTGTPKPLYWPAGKIAKGEERFPIHDVTWFQVEILGCAEPHAAAWLRAGEVMPGACVGLHDGAGEAFHRLTVGRGYHGMGVAGEQAATSFLLQPPDVLTDR